MHAANVSRRTQNDHIHVHAQTVKLTQDEDNFVGTWCAYLGRIRRYDNVVDDPHVLGRG